MMLELDVVLWSYCRVVSTKQRLKTSFAVAWLRAMHCICSAYDVYTQTHTHTHSHQCVWLHWCANICSNFFIILFLLVFFLSFTWHFDATGPLPNGLFCFLLSRFNGKITQLISLLFFFREEKLKVIFHVKLRNSILGLICSRNMSTVVKNNFLLEINLHFYP